MLLVGLIIVRVPLEHPFYLLLMLVLGSISMGALGLIAGLMAEKFEHLAAFQNYLIMPATFLSGVFYSIHSLPAVWQTISHFNPFFYLIDGVRFGFLGKADVSIYLSLSIALGLALVASGICLKMLHDWRTKG